MGVIKRGILGGFSGKVANIVGSSWKGIAVVRSLPLSVANPDTTAQRTQRGKFRNASKLASALLVGFIKPLWDAFAQQMSGYNAFIQANIDKMTPAGDFVPSNFVLARGRLGTTPVDGSTSEGDTKLTLTWNPTPEGSFQSADDKAYVVFMDSKGIILGTSAGIVDRSAGQLVMTGLDLQQAEGQLFAAVAFARADGTVVGNTSVWNY